MGCWSQWQVAAWSVPSSWIDGVTRGCTVLGVLRNRGSRQHWSQAPSICTQRTRRCDKCLLSSWTWTGQDGAGGQERVSGTDHSRILAPLKRRNSWFLICCMAGCMAWLPRSWARGIKGGYGAQENGEHCIQSFRALVTGSGMPHPRERCSDAT